MGIAFMTTVKRQPKLPLRHALLTLAFVGVTSLLCAQYPRITSDIQAEANRRRAEADARSDAAWTAAQPVIEAWAATGKPYLPGAARPSDLPQADIPAFPGAQGGGMYSFGGRGGKIFVVTNLNDSGPGSFREAAEAGGPRIVIFNVAGIIHLKERVRIRAPYITIAGSTAPGDGVCIAGDTVELETHDVVIRHMRFRRGATWVGDRNDSLGGHPVGNILIDHVSTSWGLDENLSMYRHVYSPPDGGKDLKLPTVNITIQNSLSAEALDTYNHAFGSTLGGYNSTFLRNLWASNSGRNPSVGMFYDFTFANNVIFNWRYRTIDGGDHRSFFNIINNYFKPGPATSLAEPSGWRILRPESRRAKPPVDEFGKAYVAGNIVEGNARVTADNWDGGVQIRTTADGNAEELLKSIRAKKPYPHAWLELLSAEDAFEYVLANAGATRPRRDAVDARVIESVRTGRPTYQTGIITDIEQVGGFPPYEGTPYPDSDGDGLPDDWETRYGLDPHDASDAHGDLNGDGYTNIEEFINGDDPTALKPAWTKPPGYVDLWKDRDLRN